ncbi:MAG: RidA family protein [Nitrococcus sp.]|nr:RidA family protein [Nitrococcus sp.]
MSREIIRTDNAPRAIGPYSQAVHVGETVYLSGQIALDPRTMELVTGGIAAQTRRVFDNLRAVCEAAGGDLARIVKLTIYLTDLSQYAEVNELMSEYFREPYPARAAIGIAALPREAAIEIEAIMSLSG